MKSCKHTALILLAATYFLTASMAYAASPQSPTASGQVPATARGTQEQHPVIRKALQQLEAVRNELQNKAAHDFQGHRENALKHVDEAIQELRLALQSDTK
jgi:DNA-binding FrmR family transcriptional regulator